MAEVVNMGSMKANTPEETKSMLTELERRRKEAEDYSKDKVHDSTLRGVLINFMDQRTSDHSAMHHGTGTSYTDLRNHVLKFINNTKTQTSGRGAAPMNIGALGSQSAGQEEDQEMPQWDANQQWPYPARAMIAINLVI